MIERSRRFPRRPPAAAQFVQQPSAKETIRKTLEAELQFAQQKVAELQEQEQSMKKQHHKRVKKKQPLMSEGDDDDENVMQEPPKKKSQAQVHYTIKTATARTQQ